MSHQSNFENTTADAALPFAGLPRHRVSPVTASALPGPHDILRRTLPNGITILAHETWSAPLVVLEGYLLVGNLDEPAGLPGLASFTTGMLGRGTLRRSFTEINETVEAVGASVGFGADRHITGFSIEVADRGLDLVLDVLADELNKDRFSCRARGEFRGLRMTAIAERENDTRQMAGRAFRELMFGAHPLGRDMLGDRRSVAAINRDLLVEFYETYFRPQGMVVAIVGALPAEEAANKIAAAFGDWEGARMPRPALAMVGRPETLRERHVPMPDKSQSDTCWAGRRCDAMRRTSTRTPCQHRAGSLRDDGQLGVNVRERQDMAYYASSRLSADREPGTWIAYAGVNPANVEPATQAILDEIKRLRDEPVPPDELEDSKRYLTGSMPLQLETNDGVASVLADMSGSVGGWSTWRAIRTSSMV